MISEIQMKNFMSHANSKVKLEGATIAVTGENGSGKSAFLETLPYAYYGLGRETLSGMSRIKGDGSHKVTVVHDDGVVVSRGCKPSGTGFCTIHVDGELKAKGREANAWIEDYLGMDVDTYMLTAFFGLKDVRHDTLINVPPAARLETLQRIAKIGPYKAFSKRVKEDKAEAEMSYERCKARKEGAESALSDIPELKNRLKASEKQEAVHQKEIHTLKEKRRDLQVEEEKYQTIIKERERLSAERDAVRRDIKRLESDQANLEEIIEVSKDQFTECKTWKLEAETALKGKEDPEVIREKMRTHENEAVRLKALADLRGMATGMEIDKCPLCSAEVTRDTLNRWIIEYKEMTDQSQDERNVAKRLQAEAHKVVEYQSTLGKLIERMERVLEESKEASESLKGVTRELRKQTDVLEKLDQKYLDISEKLGEEYRGIRTKISDISELIDAENVTLGNVRGTIREIMATLKHAEKAEVEIDKSKGLMKKARLDVESYKALQTAWSRYGIPMSLIKEIMRGIEDRATAVYQSFDNGHIEVREVEDRGKPGVQFFLSDRKGQRTFNQLSEGEKVMFFVAIRVAIAQIIAEDGVKVDYLILDEAMGNLSPKRRDDMVRLVNKVLRRLFPMVAMVSHTEMRDIFTQTIKVSADNDESKIEVA